MTSKTPAGKPAVQSAPSRWRRAAFAAITVGLTTAVCDVTLSSTSRLSPRLRYYLSPPWARASVPDPVLGQRMSPFYPGHDKWGFRNPDVPATVSVLAVGDSVTYGYAADSNSSWPRQLEALSGLRTYNAGVGGYGPCEYERLVDELMVLQPSTVLMGLFIGNDLSDAYLSVYVEHRCLHLERFGAGMLSPADVRETEQRIQAFRRSMNLYTGVEEEPPPPRSVREWLSRHSSLYALGRDLYTNLRPNQYQSPFRERLSAQDSFEQAASQPARVAYDADPRFRTVFVPSEVALSRAVDKAALRVREGVRITEIILSSLQAKLRRTEVRFIVVVVPAKSSAYAEVIRNSSVRPPDASVDLLQASDRAERVTNELREFMRQNAIEFVDTTAAIRACFARGLAPYPETDDPHPNAVGYRAIAEAIVPLLTGHGPSHQTQLAVSHGTNTNE